MEQSRLSFRSLSLAALLHLIFLFLLFYFTQSDAPFSLFNQGQGKQQEEAAVVWMPPAQPPQGQQLAAPAASPMPQPLAQPHDPTEQQPAERAQEPEEKMEHHDSQPRPAVQPTRRWSPDRARQAWRKPQQPNNSSATNAPAPQQQFKHGLMHQIIEGIPIEDQGIPLRQRVNSQFVKEGQEHYQGAIVKSILYELNKQKIMEASINLPRKIVLRLVLERNGKLIDAQLVEPSYSPRFDESCLQAIRHASPYRTAPDSYPGDPITIEFTLYHDQTTQQNSKTPTPIMFYGN